MSSSDTLFLGKVIRHFDSLDSTNEHLKGLLRTSKVAEGIVVVANHQSAGKGQMGASWHSTSGLNLLCSTLLQPAFLRPDQLFSLTQISSLAVIALLEDLGINDLWIKWPNDICVGTRKIAGLLIENILKGSLLTDVIVGLGLNINEVDFPALLKDKVTSISIEKGQSFDVLELMFKYIKNLEQYYLLLKANKAVAISEQYESVLLGKGIKSTFIHSSGERFEGIIQGVDHAGKLMVLKEGETSFFQNKEVQFIIN